MFMSFGLRKGIELVEALASGHTQDPKKVCLKDPSQPPPFLMPSKLLILHGEAKSRFFAIGYVPESMFNNIIVRSLTVISFVPTCSE